MQLIGLGMDTLRYKDDRGYDGIWVADAVNVHPVGLEGKGGIALELRKWDRGQFVDRKNWTLPICSLSLVKTLFPDD